MKTNTPQILSLLPIEYDGNSVKRRETMFEGFRATDLSDLNLET